MSSARVSIGLALAALAVNLHLLVMAFTGSSIAGCGGGPCDEVLASRWSSLAGMPVTVFGTLAYLALLTSHVRRLTFTRVPVLGMISGAALWFIFVQAVILRKFCPWCMAAHALGLSIVVLEILRGASGTFRRIAAWGTLALIAIALSQVYGPAPASHRIEGGKTVSAGPRPHASTVSFNDGRFVYDTAAHPRLGPVDAERVLVEFFDYQCDSCRMMSGYLDALVASHPGRVAVLLMPVPLESSCNSHLGHSNKAHPGSCAIARIALAVWRKRPDAFAAFHKGLMTDPSEALARRLALGLMTEEDLDSELSDPWIGESIQSNIAAWRGLSKNNDKLPKMLIRDKRVLHGLPPGQEEFLRVMESELGF